MPGKRKRSRKNERKSVIKRRRKSRKRGIPRGLFAKTTKMAFRYVDTIGINPGITNTVANHTFRANGMYDPDFTGVGHQPYGFDQYMAFYQHYTVIGAKITATFMPDASTIGGQCYAGVSITPGSAMGITDINTLTERRSNRSGIATPLTTKPLVIRRGLNLSKYFGQKVLQEDNNAGTASANPVELAYFQVYAGTNNNGVIDPTNIQVRVQIDYLAVLHEPKIIGGS